MPSFSGRQGQQPPKHHPRGIQQRPTLPPCLVVHKSNRLLGQGVGVPPNLHSQKEKRKWKCCHQRQGHAASLSSAPVSSRSSGRSSSSLKPAAGFILKWEHLFFEGAGREKWKREMPFLTTPRVKGAQPQDAKWEEQFCCPTPASFWGRGIPSPPECYCWHRTGLNSNDPKTSNKPTDSN